MKKYLVPLTMILLFAACNQAPQPAADTPGSLTSFKGEITLDIRDSKPDWDLFLYKKDAICGEGLCIGYDSGDAVSRDYNSKFSFTGGTILKVIYDVSDDAYVNVERDFNTKLATQ